MNVPQTLNIDPLLPKTSRAIYAAKCAHLLKIGYVAVRSATKLENRAEDPHQAMAREFAMALYDAFEESPSVLELKPRRDASDELTSTCMFAVEKDGPALLSLGDYIELRVALSEQLRREYGGFPDAPEQFRVAYDGRLFFAWCEVAQIPLLSSVSQGAREFLQKTIAALPALELLDSEGPSPIHPDIYFLAVERKDGTHLPTRFITSIGTRARDLIVLYSAEVPIDVAVQLFRSAARFTLDKFYDARSNSWSINDTLTEIGELNDQLSGCLVKLFERSAITAMVSGIPRRIRSLLSQLHMQFQVLSRDELDLRESIDQMNFFMEGSALVEPLDRYLNKEAGDHEAIDKDAQLRLMDYAGSEASNVSVIQATLWAAIIGALVGALTTLLLSSWIN